MKKPEFIEYCSDHRPTPVLTGESARRFLELAKANEERAKNRTPEMDAEFERIMKTYNAVMAKSKIK